MAIFLKHKYGIPPLRWGGVADIQYAIKTNSEKIYGIPFEDYVFAIPLSFGQPVLNYIASNKFPDLYGTIYKGLRPTFSYANTTYIALGSLGVLYSKWSIIASFDPFSLGGGSVGDGRTIFTNDLGGWNDDVLFGVSPEGSGLADTRYKLACTHQDSINSVRTNVIYTPTVNTKYNCVVTSDAAFLQLSINGQLEDTTAKVGANLDFGNNNVYIGRNEGQASYKRGFDGIIYNVVLISKTINTEQIALFNDLPYGLYQPVPRPVYSFHVAVGWTGKVCGVTNPAKINGIAVANIAKVIGV